MRMAKQIMPGKGVPFPIEEWPSVLIQGLTILNRNNWFPVMTLMVGNPGETDEDCKATLDLIYEVERRGLFAFFVPSIFTPLHDTRLAAKQGVQESRQLTPAAVADHDEVLEDEHESGAAQLVGSDGMARRRVVVWLWKLRKMNGPNFTWPLLLFASALPEWLMARMGKIYRGKPLTVKSRKELLATIKPQHWKYLRPDNGDLPDGWEPSPAIRTRTLPARR